MIVSRFPYPLEKGDKLRAYHQLRELHQYYDITLVALTDKAISHEQMDQVNQFCKHLEVCRIRWYSKFIQLLLCFFSQRPFQVGYFYSWSAKRRVGKLIENNNFAHLFCQLLRTSEYVKKEHQIPKTIDYMDALSTGIHRRIQHQKFYSKWLFRSEAKRLMKYEQVVFDYFEHHVIISEQDKQLIQHPDRKRIVCIPNGIDASFFEDIDRTITHDFVFVGNMSYAPNVEAVQFIAEYILPEFPGTTLLVSGSSPHSSIVALAHKNSQIELTGWVDDIRTSYARGQLFLAPMMIGTGMQNKLLEAMAMKVPCVTTPLANNAIKAKHGSQVMVGKGKEQLIKCIQDLRANEDLRYTIAENGSAFVRENYSWKTSVETLVELFRS